MKKAVISLLLAFVFLFSLPFIVQAEEKEDALKEYGELLDTIPEDIAKLLPDEFFSSSAEDVESGIAKATSWEYVWDVVFDLLGLNLNTAIKTLVKLCSLLVLCSLLSMIKNSIKNENLSYMLTLVGSVVVASAIVELSKAPIERINLFFEHTKALVNTMTPIVCSLYAMGGNVSTAVVQNFGMMSFLAIFENVCITGLQAILGICMALAISGAFMPNIDVKPLADAIKKTFTFFVGFVMLVFSSVLSAQTVLASKSDSLGTKTVKMFAGQMIPIVGGTVGESLRTAGASIEYLRSTVGIGIIVLFLLFVLPTLLSVWGYRLSFIASGAISGLLGCEREGKMIGEIASIYGYILAIVSISSVALLLLMTLFVNCSSALSR